MAVKNVYPLEDVLKVKQRRVEAAEKVLKEKLALLAKEQEKLIEREKERDAVKSHYNDKMKQMRKELDGGTTSPKIQQMKAYIKVVQQKLVVEEKKVKDQQEQVVIAEKNVQIARTELMNKRKEVDKLETHKEDWTKVEAKAVELAEAREHDELGNITYSLHHRKE